MLHDLNHPQSSSTRRIAVIGAGVAGFSAAWLLSPRHEVTLYEENDWIGGHAHTVDVETSSGAIAVDTGFIVYNDRSYPNFSAMLDHLGVASVPTNMSFAASTGGGRFEYSSDFLGLIGQKRNIARPQYWKMLADIVRFYGHAEGLLDSPEIEEVTLGEFLSHHDYSAGLIDYHILPMCAAIWSSSADQIRAFPMRAFVRFFASHNLFAIGRRIVWRTVKGGSRSYIEALKREFSGRIITANGARRVGREDGLVVIEDSTGKREVYTDVVLGTHADTSLRLLADADALETSLLGAFPYTENVAVLHEDRSLMPRRRHVWASWNYIGEDKAPDERALCVSYWMNRLQGLDRRQPLFITLNPTHEPRPSAIKRSFSYSHPLFDHAALAAQRDLWRLQGRRNTWFCGSYFGYGFHEDALQSGLAVAERFGVRRPWTVNNESERISTEPDVTVAAQ